MPKKLSVIGRGTAGVLGLGHFLRWTDWEIDWYYDPSTKPLSVGEGANKAICHMLSQIDNFTSHNLSEDIGGYFKTGVYKKGWGVKGDGFFHSFKPPEIAYHFSAEKLQKYLFDKFKVNKRIKLIEKNVSHENIDSDFIFDCGGFPKNFNDQYHISEYIPVNSAYVTQCYWPFPQFSYSLQIARPYGWVFGIPLKERCAIGYVYNSKITDLEDIKRDVKNVFEEFNLTPSQKTLHINFRNYYRNKIIDSRIAYSGTSAFFLEPLEATSLSIMIKTQQYAFDVWNKTLTEEEGNNEILKIISSAEDMIMLHYFAGSIYNNDFWKYAKGLGEECIKRSLNKDFIHFLSEKQNGIPEYREYGTFPHESYQLHIDQFGIRGQIQKLIKDKENERR